MADHVFGGDWTSDKLERIRKYLHAYTTIFKKNPGARHYLTTYVDAFAGTGQRVSSSHQQAAEIGSDDSDARSFLKGSAQIALEVAPPFDEYIFVERSSKRVKELQQLRESFPERKNAIQINRAEANAFLMQWCKQTDWRQHRAVVFLDPYGMQVIGQRSKPSLRLKASTCGCCSRLAWQ